MECNVSELVKRGHDQAAELKASCGAVDVRTVAQLISDLATQLDVQLTRSNALAAENAWLKNAITAVSKTSEECEINGDELKYVVEPSEFDALTDLLDETPATDAFLAEVRAQGVEMAMEHMQSSGSLTFGDCYISLNEFAAQLRKGGNQ
ncbi:hypothetical protein [Escherichia coli]|uniref:hypothetical protein n=1 Tax=Escherichia coli TaxID=562 RepID=UPI000775015D|nr:hypothetical protein [Escherichia coli]EFM2219718.1 hypothetical protein [Escherichia coli]KXR63172.1 hypothetical protein AUQ28_07415 [Escherichia coli]